MPRRAEFGSPEELRAWFEANHATVQEMQLRCIKSGAGEKGMTYRQALDEALCFGWIDGVRHSLDQAIFLVRFTPRKRRLEASANLGQHSGHSQIIGPATRA